jgi:hypothetical protein
VKQKLLPIGLHWLARVLTHITGFNSYFLLAKNTFLLQNAGFLQQLHYGVIILIQFHKRVRVYTICDSDMKNMSLRLILR